MQRSLHSLGQILAYFQEQTNLALYQYVDPSECSFIVNTNLLPRGLTDGGHGTMSHVWFFSSARILVLIASHQHLCSIAYLYEEVIGIYGKVVVKDKGSKNHTFLVVYECKYCDVKVLVLVEGLDQQPENDWEVVLEGLNAELVEHENVFGRPWKEDKLILLQNC